MSKISEMEATIRELRDIASSINEIANWLTDAFGSADDTEAAPARKRHIRLKKSEQFWQKSQEMASPLRFVTFFRSMEQPSSPR